MIVVNIEISGKKENPTRKNIEFNYKNTLPL